MWKFFLLHINISLIVVSSLFAKNITNDYLYFNDNYFYNNKIEYKKESFYVNNYNENIYFIEKNSDIIDFSIEEDNIQIINNEEVKDLDSLNKLDSINVKKEDTKIYYTNKHLGSLGKTYKSISINDFIEYNYYTYNEILINNLLCYPLFVGVPGNSNYISFLGALPSSNKFTMSNVSMNDLFYTSTNLNAFAPEFTRNIEVAIGTEATIYGGTNGVLVNFQPTLFNTSKPYTRIWYNQGNHKHIAIDGIFSQNFMPNWNITTGFRTMFSDGSYSNSNIKSWNGRFALRYDISNNSNTSFIYNFTNYYSGDFGGILFEDFNNDNDNIANLLKTNFNNLSSRQYRNDIIINYCYAEKDSNIIFKSSTFFTNEENNIFWDKDTKLMEIDTNGKNSADAQIIGINAKCNYKLYENIILNTGIEFGYDNLSKTILIDKYAGIFYNMYTLLNYSLNLFSFDIGGRYEKKYGVDLTCFASKLNFILNDNNNLFIDLSLSNNFPLPVFNYKNEKHYLAILGWKNIKDNYDIVFNLFYRRIHNPLLLILDTTNIYSFSYKNIDVLDRKIFGFVGSTKFSLIKNVNFKAELQSYFIDNNSPNCCCKLSCDYTYNKGKNFITAGVGTAIQINNNLLYYNPIFKMYAQTDVKNDLVFNGLNAYISAKLGHAFIRMGLNNIIGTDYSFLAYYPMQIRELSLSLTWTLL